MDGSMAAATGEVQGAAQMMMMIQNSSSSGLVSSRPGSARDHHEKEEEMTRSALALFRSKEEEIERKKMEVREKVQSELGRVEEATKRLAQIRQEVEAVSDPMRKEVVVIRRRIDTLCKELKPLSQSCQKREREYKEVVELLNQKNEEKGELVGKLVELVSESEKLRLKQLEELSKNIEINS